jgi:hypothetical protein
MIINEKNPKRFNRTRLLTAKREFKSIYGLSQIKTPV